MKPRIKYQKGFKYQLAEDYIIKIPILVGKVYNSQFLKITFDGSLIIKTGYAWDGPSGPAFDTKTFYRASLVHDALYQLMRQKVIPIYHRAEADKEMYRICREDGMAWIRAKWCYHGVRGFSKSAASPMNKREILTAP
jgi:hypothetical protein